MPMTASDDRVEELNLENHAATVLSDNDTVIKSMISKGSYNRPYSLSSQRIAWWRQDEKIQNFGDYVSDYLWANLPSAIRLPADVYRLIGSTICDFLVDQDLGTYDQNPDGRTAFWCCGARDESSVSVQLLKRSVICSVRGPLTRDLLGLSKTTVLGDSALLFPLLHSPNHSDRTAGKTVCVPHILDKTADDELLRITGADLILRPSIAKTHEALLAIIDDIASAEFILAGSLHAAVFACAYERPFCYFDNGHIDIPFKWRDFSASVHIGTFFVASVDEGRRVYETLIVPRLQRPLLFPLLASAPFCVKTEYLFAAALYDAKRQHRSDDFYPAALSTMIDMANKSITAYGVDPIILGRLNKKLGQLEITHAETRNLLSERTILHSAAVDRIDALQRKLGDAEEQRAKIDADLRRVSDLYSAAADRIDALQRKLGDAEEQRAKIDADLRRVSDLYSAAADRIDALQRKLGDEEEQRAKIDADLRRVIDLYTAAADRIDALQRKLGDAEEQRAKIDADLRRVSDLYSAAADRIDALQRKLGDEEEQRAKIDADLRRVSDLYSAAVAGKRHADEMHAMEIGNLNQTIKTQIDAIRTNNEAFAAAAACYDESLSEKNAEIDGLNRQIGRQRQSLGYRFTHAPRQIGRWLRAPFARLAFHKSGKPRGWIRKLLFHSNGRVRGVFVGWVYRASGGPRSAFKCWLITDDDRSRFSLATVPSPDMAPLSSPTEIQVVATGSILVAADFPPLYDQHSGGLRLKTLIGMIGNQGRPIIFASSVMKSNLPGVLASDDGRAHYENVLKHCGVVDFAYGAEELDALLRDPTLDLRFAILSFPTVAETFLPIIRKHQPAAKVFYDMVDFHAQRMEREAVLKNDPKLAEDASTMYQLEVSLAMSADVTIAISADEKKALLELAPAAVIEIVPNIFELSAKSPPGPQGRRDVLFLGGFWHQPNGDAVKWFVEKIWPLVGAAAQECRFLIAGSNPGVDILALSEIEGVEVLGYVADLEPLYNAARVCVAPLRYGAGVKGKVGEAMAYGLPIVVTSIGAQGMCVQDCEHFLVADDPDAFAQHVIDLLRDDALWIKTQVKAREFVESQFSVRALTEKVENLFHA